MTAPASSLGSNKRLTIGQLLPSVVWPSGDASGVKDAAAINAAVSALPTTGGTVTLVSSAPWYIACGSVTVNRSNVYISAPGCYIWAVGAGDVFRIYDSSTYGRPLQGGGLIGSPIVDGTNCTGNSCAFHGGDIFAMSVFVQPQNFNAGTTSKGVWLDNNYYWSELCQANIRATNCTAGVVFDVHVVSGNVTGSYDRSNLEIYIDQVNASYDGVVWQAGSLMVAGKMTIRGNFNSSGTPVTSAVLKVVGQTPGGTALASYSSIGTSLVDVACECNSGTYTPQTMVFTNSFNQISNCYGQLDFGGGGPTNFTPSNNPNSLVTFYGPAAGDVALQTWLLTGATNAWLGGAGQAIASATPASVTAMSGALTGFTTYVIRAWIPYASTATAGVPKFAFTGPGQVATRLTYKFYSATALVSVVQETDFTAVVSGPTLTSSTGLLMEVEGTILPSGAGTLQLTAAEGTGGDAFNIALGAYMTCMPLQN